MFFRILPRSLGRQLLNALAFAAYHLDRRHRHIADVNLQIAFPHLSRAERNRITRLSFQATAQNLLEISRLSGLSRENLGSLVQYDPERGWNNFEAAKSRGKPILYLTGHFSAWELLPAAHALFGNPLSFVTRPLDNPLLEEYLTRVREACGNTVISKKRSARQILENLRSRGAVGILMDQNTDPQEGIFAEFFGLPAGTSTGLALFALRADAVVLPGYLTPMKSGRYYIRFLPPLELVRTGDRNHDVREATAMINRILESIIREQPESWLWGHKRWSYQPHGNPQDIYSLSQDELRQFLDKNRRG